MNKSNYTEFFNTKEMDKGLNRAEIEDSKAPDEKLRIRRALERDPTYARNFNPRKIKAMINFTMPEAIT